MDGSVMSGRRLLALPVVGLGGALLVALAAAGALTAQPMDQRLADCGASTPGNEVLASVNLGRGREFWNRLPAALGAPELDNDRPALLVVFKGDYTWFRTGEVFQNVVCVYQDGYPHIYPDVNLTGANIKP
jgi:hypothetical protein